MSDATKEPWEVQSIYLQNVTNYGLDESKEVIVIGDEMGDIALINNTYPHKEQKAFAALIAAAPELLAACKMALSRIAGECYPDHPEVVQLEKAIAKAGRLPKTERDPIGDGCQSLINAVCGRDNTKPIPKD